MAKQDFSKVFADMVSAAKVALDACKPAAMIVSEPSSGKRWLVPGGPCGFASIKVKGNTAFGKWAKAQKIAHPDYPTGLAISSYAIAPEVSQSLELKEAATRAAAKVLNAAGVTAYVDSRMD